MEATLKKLQKKVFRSNIQNISERSNI